MVVLLYARVFFLLSRCFVVFVVVRSSYVFTRRSFVTFPPTGVDGTFYSYFTNTNRT